MQDNNIGGSKSNNNNGVLYEKINSTSNELNASSVDPNLSTINGNSLMQ